MSLTEYCCKKILAFGIVIGFIVVSLLSCHDPAEETSGADTVKLMNGIRDLNNEGDLLSLTIKVTDDGGPVTGASVSISNDVSSLASTLVTDANGMVTFQKVRVGHNSISLSKEDYLNATAILDFGPLSDYYKLVKNPSGTITDITPDSKSKSATLQLFSKSMASGSTAKLEGIVTIETDVTNQQPEIPQNIILKASLSSGLVINSGSEGVTIISYTFDSGGFCEATVDNATGAYSMIVPASAAGLTLGLSVPVLDLTQKMAVSRLNGGDITPEFRSVPAQFGPEVGFDPTLPVVAGVKGIFPVPPPAGAGLSFTFAAVPRSLHAENGAFIDYNPTDIFDEGETVYQMTSRGSGYQSSPTVSITGGGGTGATMTASLQGYVTALTVTNTGSGYTGDFTISIELVDMNDVVNQLNTFIVTNENGQLPVSIALPTSGYAFTEAESFYSLADLNIAAVKRLQATVIGDDGTGATVDIIVNGQVETVQLTNPGSGYSTAPAITFSGGGSGDQATLAIKEFRKRWSIVVNNSGVTPPYMVMPDNIEFEFASPYFETYTEGDVLDNTATVVSYWDALKVSGGEVVLVDGAQSYITNGYSASAPKPVITSSTSMPASVTVILDNGAVSDFNILNTGSGYNNVFSLIIAPMISTAPGSGATIQLSGFSSNINSGITEWDGTFTITNPGSGYLDQLNLQNVAPVNPGAYNYDGPPATITVKTGEVKTLNIRYGTGKRKENVD